MCEHGTRISLKGREAGFLEAGVVAATTAAGGDGDTFEEMGEGTTSTTEWTESPDFRRLEASAASGEDGAAGSRPPLSTPPTSTSAGLFGALGADADSGVV